MTVAEFGPAPMPSAGGRPTVVTIFNQKGGIGKTTTAVNLSVCLAAMGHTVVLVDLDSQSNATTGLGLVAPPTRGAYELIAGTATLAEVRKPTAFPNLFVCAATDELAGADIELAVADDPQHRLARAVKGLPGDVDYVVVDCPPALGMLPVNGLVACDWAILPVTPEPMARDGLAKAWRHIQRIRANLNRHLEVAGILLTMTGADGLRSAMAETIRAEFGRRVLATSIPYDPVVVEASSHDRPVVVHAPDSAAARAYVELAGRIVASTHARAHGGMVADDEGGPPASGVDPAPVTAVLRQWRGAAPDHPSAAGHGDDPEQGWTPAEAALGRPVVPGMRWKLAVAALLLLLGGVVGFVAGRRWDALF